MPNEIGHRAIGFSWRFLFYILSFALSILLLTACGGNQRQAENSVAPLPTGLAQPQPIQTLASPASAGVLFENISTQPYTSRSGQFSIEFPDNWRTFEQADRVLFVDPKGQAAYSVFTVQTEAGLSPQKLNEFAAQFAQDNFGQESGFEILPAAGDVIRFKSVDPSFGPAINEIAALQRGETVFVTLLTVAQNQWDASAAGLRKLVGSLKITPLSTSPLATPTSPPMWELYTNPDLNVAFLYPNNWVITQTAQSVQVVWPQYQMAFTVNAVSVPRAGEKPEALISYLNTQTQTLKAAFADLQTLSPTEFQAGNMIGYTLDYLYTGPDDEQIAGSIIALGVDNTLYRIDISSPAPVYPTALNWFNPMLQSFKIVKSEK